MKRASLKAGECLEMLVNIYKYLDLLTERARAINNPDYQVGDLIVATSDFNESAPDLTPVYKIVGIENNLIVAKPVDLELYRNNSYFETIVIDREKICLYEKFLLGISDNLVNQTTILELYLYRIAPEWFPDLKEGWDFEPYIFNELWPAYLKKKNSK